MQRVQKPSVCTRHQLHDHEGVWHSALSQMKEGGYDQKAIETATIVASRTAEVSQKAWGMMRAFAAAASQQLETYTGEGGEGQGRTHSGFVDDNNSTAARGQSGTSTKWDLWDDEEEDRRAVGQGAGVGGGDGGGKWDDWGSKDSGAKKVATNGGSDRQTGEGGGLAGGGRNYGSVAKPPVVERNVSATQAKKAGGGGDGWAGWDDGAEDHHVPQPAAEKQKGTTHDWDDWGDS